MDDSPARENATDAKGQEEQGNQRDAEIEALDIQKERDSRSVYVGNVDFQSTPEQLEIFFRTVGSIERITIIFDKYTGLPKGYAYVEFSEIGSATRAMEEIHGKVFRGREIRVSPKRTNLPGYRVHEDTRSRGGKERARGRGRARGRARGRGRGNRNSLSERKDDISQ